MARADYAYGITELGGKPFIVIEDLNKTGRCSVTNDIDNVIDEIATKERINPVEHFIVYKDSRGIWDGYNFSTKQFIPLNEHGFKTAMKNMLKADYSSLK